MPLPVTKAERVFLGFEPDAKGYLANAAPTGMPAEVWREMQFTYRSIAAHNAFGRKRCGWSDHPAA